MMFEYLGRTGRQLLAENAVYRYKTIILEKRLDNRYPYVNPSTGAQ